MKKTRLANLYARARPNKRLQADRPLGAQDRSDFGERFPGLARGSRRAAAEAQSVGARDARTGERKTEQDGMAGCSHAATKQSRQMLASNAEAAQEQLTEWSVVAPGSDEPAQTAGEEYGQWLASSNEAIPESR